VRHRVLFWERLGRSASNKPEEKVAAIDVTAEAKRIAVS
jgi:hypothetical protein